MAFSITEFKSSLKQGGARSALFQVQLNFPSFVTSPLVGTSGSIFLVKSTTLPGSTISSIDVLFHGKPIKVAGDRTYDTWETTIINDEDFAIRNAIEQWMDGIAGHKLNNRSVSIVTSGSEGESASYKKSMYVTQYSSSGDELRTYEFIGAFPTGLGTISLDWGTDSIEEFTCTWTYDRFKVRAGGKNGIELIGKG